MKEFDNRFFDADGANAGADEHVAVGETVEEQPETEEIPDELSGISEETARAIMAESGGEEEAQDDDTQTNADADSDNKQYESDGVSNQRVPYGRFKEELDKKKELEEQNRQLQAQLEQFRAMQTQAQQAQPPTTNAQQAQPTQPAQQAQAQQPRLNKEAVAQINQLIKQQAMQMSGLSQDDIDDMEFMDDDDPRKQSWQAANDYARLNVYAGIQQMQMQRAAQAQQFLKRHEALIKDYNEFASNEMKEADFNEIQNYATNEYFEKGIPQSDQQAIAEAYARIEKNVASPGDIALIKRYYADAKASYRRSHPAKPKTNANNVKRKVQQAQSFPRSEQVAGAADVGGNVTAASLEQMLQTRDWDDIPEKYQKMLLSGQITQ